MRPGRHLRDYVVGVVWILAAVGTVPALAKTVYVSKTGSDADDGLTWETAKLTVQEGLNTAVADDQVWVAAGTYVERVTLKSGVTLYGGFGGTETELSQRDWIANIAILDGSRAGSVVTVPSGAVSTTGIDGFTIRNGYGTRIGIHYPGGAIYCSGASPVISNNTIADNGASHGGAIYCSTASPVISNNTIRGNSASYAGAIYCYASSPVISNNTITSNVAHNDGGGIWCAWASSPKVLNNAITGNTAKVGVGGGIHLDSCSPTVSNNTITGNIAGLGVGGEVYFYASSSSFSLMMSNNLVAFNSSGICRSGGTPTLRNNCVYNPDGANYSGLDAGLGDILADPNLLATPYGEVHLTADSPCRDAGLDAAVEAGWVDMDGQARIQGMHVDIGADEFDGATPSFTPRTVRVSPVGDDANDGSTWAAAKQTVQAGIDAAASSSGGVWVAAGTYNERITLRVYAHVYGGFAGIEGNRDDRNWLTNLTILDGGADGSVVTASCGHRVNTIDGFTIRNGTGTQIDESSFAGGGIFCHGSSPVISHNAIKGNTENNGSGGGIYCSFASPVILNNMI